MNGGRQMQASAPGSGLSLLNAGGGGTRMFTLAVYTVSPLSLSLILPLTASGPGLPPTQLVVPDGPYGPKPAPQSNAYWRPAPTSTLDGSDGPASEPAKGLPAVAE